jgi:hypothetical protein
MAVGPDKPAPLGNVVETALADEICGSLQPNKHAAETMMQTDAGADSVAEGRHPRSRLIV